MIKKLFVSACVIAVSLSSAHAETSCYSVNYNLNGRMQSVNFVTDSQDPKNEIMKYVVAQNLRKVSIDGEQFQRSMENIVIHSKDCHAESARHHTTYSTRYRT